MAIQSRHPAIHHLLLAALAGAAVLITAPTVAAADPSIETLESRLTDSTAELDVIVEDYNRVNDELTEVGQRYENLTASTDVLRHETAVATEEIAEIATALYRNGPVVAPAPLMSGSPTAFTDRLTVLEYLSLDQQQWLSRLDTARSALETDLLLLTDLTEQLDDLSEAKSAKETEITEAMRDLGRAQSAAIGAGYQFGPNLAAPAIPGGDTGSAGAALQFVHGALGAPYEWGGTGPGYDCSGLTSAAWAQAGVPLPHSSQAQYNAVGRVDRGQLQPGDLVFYFDDLHHVGMYVGEGKIIHAPSAGQTVQVAPMDQMPIQGYGRPG